MRSGRGSIVLTVVLALLVFVNSSCLNLDGGCGNELLGEARSPDGKLKALVFERDCGATTGASTQISILPVGKRLSNESGNVFVADTNHGEAPSGRGGGPVVEVQWLNERELLIKHDVRARIFKAEQSRGRVEIHYEKFAS